MIQRQIMKEKERLPLKTILTNFLNHVDSMEDESYEKEFQSLKSFSDGLKSQSEYSCHEGEKDVNRKKNRYKDILPFDYTRVTLSEYPGVPGSDYINANFIKGASGSNAYIASQGPLPHTVNDFWRMVVECEVQVIVMACNEQEAGKHKCERYWGEDDSDIEDGGRGDEGNDDDNDFCVNCTKVDSAINDEANRPKKAVKKERCCEEKQYGNFFVKLLKSRDICPDFLVRTMRLRWKNDFGKEEERTVCQFHYSAWPDHGIPIQVKPLLEMVRLIRDCQASETLPVLIHCSAGCGRTGTICAIDFIWGLLRTGKLTGDFSLYELVKEMRKQRIAIVQTVDQYILVHRAVKELFLEQMRVIDSHPYENVDDNGMPICRNHPEEITPDYETVFVNEKSIERILSEKLSQNLRLSSSTSKEDEDEDVDKDINDNENDSNKIKKLGLYECKPRNIDSLNLESSRNSINIGTSASAAASTTNSSDNLLEEFHRDISKSTPKLFEPAMPPESSRDTAAPQRFKKGNLRLTKTDDGHWKLEEHDPPPSAPPSKAGKKSRKKSSNNNNDSLSSSSSAETPLLLRKPSMKKIKAFFNKSSPNDEGKVSPKFEQEPPPTPNASSSARFDLDHSLVSGSRSVPNSLDRKTVRKSSTSSETTLKPPPPKTPKPSLPIKRSKSMKVTYNASPPPKPKRLIAPEYANVSYSGTGCSVPELTVKLGAKRNEEVEKLEREARDEEIVVDDRALKDYIMASFESAEKEGDKIHEDTTSSGNSPSDSSKLLKSNVSNLAPFVRSKERRNSFRQAVDNDTFRTYEPVRIQRTDPVPEYENVTYDTIVTSSPSAVNPYEPIQFQEQSRGHSNKLQSVGLVAEVLQKQKQQKQYHQRTSPVIRKHSSSSSLLGNSKPPPPYKQPPSLSSESQKRSSSVSRIPHRLLPSSHDGSRHYVQQDVPRVPQPPSSNTSASTVFYNNNNNNNQSPPELPKRENAQQSKAFNIPRRHSRDSTNLSSHDDSDLPNTTTTSSITTTITTTTTTTTHNLNNNSKKLTNRLSLGDFSNVQQQTPSSGLPPTRHKTHFSQDSVNMGTSPPGIDLDVVAAMMHNRGGGTTRDISKPLFGRTLAGVLSGAAANLRSRLLGSSSSSLTTTSDPLMTTETTITRSTPSPSSRGDEQGGELMTPSAIPLTVSGASARNLNPYNFPNRHDVRPLGPRDPPTTFLRKQEYL